MGGLMISGIIFASGFSKRMGQDKLLIELGGQKIIERVIKSAVNSKLDRLVIVYRKEELKKIAEDYDIEGILNEKANLGQSESMRLAIKNIEDKSDFMFIMGDQPFISSDLINQLIDEYKKTDNGIVVPYYNLKRGMPSIMSWTYRDELLNIKGDRGGRDLIERYPRDVKFLYFKDEKLGIDIDSLEDLERIKKWI